MIRAVFLTLSLLLSSPASACIILQPFTPEDIAAAPVVVLADVVAYSVDGNDVGHFGLHVVEAWKGASPAGLDLVWDHAMASGPPATWDDRMSRIIVALRPGDDGGFDIVVESCGSAQLLDATEANIAAVKAALP